MKEVEEDKMWCEWRMEEKWRLGKKNTNKGRDEQGEEREEMNSKGKDMT